MSKQQQMELYVANLDCDMMLLPCSADLQSTAGLVDLAVYPKSAKVRLTYDPAVVTPAALRETLAGTGFPVRARRASRSTPHPQFGATPRCSPRWHRACCCWSVGC